MASVTDIVNNAIATYFPDGNVPPGVGSYAINIWNQARQSNPQMFGNPKYTAGVIQKVSQNIPAYFQDAARINAETYGSLAATGQDTSGIVQQLNDLVKSASSFGVDATALSNTINTDANSIFVKTSDALKPNLFDTAIKAIDTVVVATVAPEIAPTVGASLGLTGAAATAAGYATIGATTNVVNAAAAGASPSDIAKAGLTGAVTGAAGSAISSAANAIVPDIGQTGAAVVGGAAKGAIVPALSGGNIGAGAAGGALGSALGTNIGGTVGNVIGGAAGSGTAAALSGGDVPASILTGAASQLGGSLAKNATTTPTTPTDTTPTAPETPTVPTAPETPTTPVAPIDTPASPTIPETPTTPPVDTTIPTNTKDVGEITVTANKDQPILDLISPTVPTAPETPTTPVAPIDTPASPTIPETPTTPPVDTTIPTNTKDVGEITVTANKDQPILDLISPTVPTPQPIVPPVNVAPITPPSNVNVPPNATDVGEITVTADKNKPILDLINPTTIPMTDVGTIDVTAPKIKDVGTIDVTAPAIKDVGEITIDATKDNAANTTVTASKDNVSSSNNTVSLLSPSVVPSKSTSTSKTPGSSSAALLGQALGTTQPDTSLVGGSPILDGEQGKRRNVWNTESLKSALGIV